jgi:hypothetical protein
MTSKLLAWALALTVLLALAAIPGIAAATPAWATPCTGEVGCTSNTTGSSTPCTGEVGCTSGGGTGGAGSSSGGSGSLSGGSTSGGSGAVRSVALARSAERSRGGGLSAGDALDIALLGMAALGVGSWLLVRLGNRGDKPGIW